MLLVEDNAVNTLIAVAMLEQWGVRVTSADSAGLAVLIEWLSVAGERGGTLAFEAVPAQLRAIARISDVEELIAGQSGG